MNLTAVDLFAGAGGATQGLKNAGFAVLGAVENDPAAALSYERNHPEVKLWVEDVRQVPAAAVMRTLGLKRGELSLLKACPPCQGFSSLAEGRVEIDAVRNDLVLDTIRFIRVLAPRAVMIENVPGLGRDQRANAISSALRAAGYVAQRYKVDAVQFGVPQRRKRLIILALRGRHRQLPIQLSAEGLDHPAPSRTAFDQVSAALEAGFEDPLSVARKLGAAAAARVAAVPVGGNRFDLPPEHQLACHQKVGTKGATASYGRIRLDEPSPTMTTRCTTVACGSFIHPTENRGITLREAAALQTFPLDYQFHGTYGEIERQIGNAVPVKMATALSLTVARWLQNKGALVTTA